MVSGYEHSLLFSLERRKTGDSRLKIKDI